MEETARKGWLIYDLQRHPAPYYFIGLIGKLTRLHPMVIHDGRISVARSLTRTEWLPRDQAWLLGVEEPDGKALRFEERYWETHRAKFTCANSNCANFIWLAVCRRCL